MASRYRRAFQRRVRQIVKVPGIEPFKVWCARPEDVIVGKLMAWDEGRSRKHETDIYEMIVFHYLGVDSALSAGFDETYAEGNTIRPQGDLHVVGLEARTLTAGLDCIPLAAWVEDISAPKVSPAASKRAFVGPAADVGFGQFR